MSEQPPPPSGLYKTLCADLRVNGVLPLCARILSHPGSLAVFLFRVSAALYRKGKIGWFPGMVLRNSNIFLNGCEIGPLSQIGPGFNIVHPFGIVMGNVKMGRNVTIYHNVTLGQLRHEDDRPPIPTVGDDVIIYAGAVLSGNIHIGKGARIGANSVVLRDVPDGYTVMAPLPRMVAPPAAKEPNDTAAV